MDSVLFQVSQICVHQRILYTFYFGYYFKMCLLKLYQRLEIQRKLKYFLACRVCKLRIEMEGMAPGMSRAAWMLEYTMDNGVSTCMQLQACLFLSILVIDMIVRVKDWVYLWFIAIHIKHSGGTAVEGSHHATAAPAVREGQPRPNQQTA